ncbi:MAG: hypothetical protein KDD63_27425, partial [Bacteroidetes bacterium]|nr:hypothetical protein [Bacteroidota bacterium]
EGGTAPHPDSFVVQRGFKSIGSPGEFPRKFDGVFRFDTECFNFPIGADHTNLTHCPLDPVTLTRTTDWQVFKSDPDNKFYYYDTDIDMLFLNIVQDSPNVDATSPLGSTEYHAGIQKTGIRFYTTPKEGAVTYTVRVKDKNYVIGGTTTCDCYNPSDKDYTEDYPDFGYTLGIVPEAHILDPIGFNILADTSASGAKISTFVIKQDTTDQGFLFKKIEPDSLQPHTPVNRKL